MPGPEDPMAVGEGRKPPANEDGNRGDGPDSKNGQAPRAKRSLLHLGVYLTVGVVLILGVLSSRAVLSTYVPEDDLTRGAILVTISLIIAFIVFSGIEGAKAAIDWHDGQGTRVSLGGAAAFVVVMSVLLFHMLDPFAGLRVVALADIPGDSKPFDEAGVTLTASYGTGAREEAIHRGEAVFDILPRGEPIRISVMHAGWTIGELRQADDGCLDDMDEAVVNGAVTVKSGCRWIEITMKRSDTATFSHIKAFSVDGLSTVGRQSTTLKRAVRDFVETPLLDWPPLKEAGRSARIDMSAIGPLADRSFEIEFNLKSVGLCRILKEILADFNEGSKDQKIAATVQPIAILFVPADPNGESPNDDCQASF